MTATSKDGARATDRRLGTVPDDWAVKPFGEVMERVRTPVEVNREARYRQIGIRSHGKGIFHKEAVSGEQIGSKRVFWVEPDCLTVNIVFAWEGAVALTAEAEAGFIASHRFPMHRPKGSVVDLGFLLRFFQTRVGVRLLGDASPGGAGRNRTLNQTALAKLPLPLPPLVEQRKIAAILASVDEAIEKTQAVIDQVQVVKKGLMQSEWSRTPRATVRFRVTHGYGA